MREKKKMKYDVIIIGSGIIGSSIAYRLSKYDCSILVLEKNNDIADEVSMANSAIVHAGHDPIDGTLKAKLNVEGSRMYPELCENLGAAYKNIGAYTVMYTPEQEETFNKLVERAKSRDIPYEVLSGEEARNIEPNLSDNISKVLSLPSTSIITPWEVTLKQLQVAVLNGTEVKLNCEVTDIEKDNDKYIIHTNSGDYESSYVINAAGLYADKIANMLEPNKYTITPKRGEYFVLSHDAKDFVKHIIYPVPTAAGKGILAIPTADENILLGPTAEIINDKQGVNTTSEGFAKLKEALPTSVKNIPYNQVIRTFAGLRPTVEGNDFIIDRNENVINLVGIDSPGIASAPAIAKYVEELIELPYQIKENYTIKNPYHNEFKELSPEEKDAYIKEHPEYGHIVCRCEQISEGEVIESIHEELGARSIKAVKKRCRPGMGKCQGGFCQPLILEILARELEVDVKEVLYDNPGSNVVLDYRGGNEDA